MEILSETLRILEFILESFIHIWPLLLITIPLAVLIKVTKLSKYIKLIFVKNIYLSITLATIIGAFAPFCSCSVIPVIASMLISGVPLAPVMSFWLASPSMDPEIFFLSVASIGWNLATARIVSTLVLSFMAGIITHLLIKSGFIHPEILRIDAENKQTNLRKILCKLRNKIS